MSRMLLKLTTIALFGWMSAAALADPPPSPKNFWRNTAHYNHYVLYERRSNTWLETVDCKVLWRFTKVSSDLNNLILRDAGRKLNVKLNYDGMWLKLDSDPAYKFYQPGTFDKRVRFFHQVNGQWTGTVSRLPGCSWEELLAGGSAPAWRFKAYGEDAGAVYLYDGSRNLRVRLNAADMWLQTNGAKSFSFFKKGYWSEN